MLAAKSIEDISKPVYRDSTNAEALPCVSGPGTPFGYYAHTLFPHFTCRNAEEAKRGALIANAAYKEGYERCQYELRLHLGLKE